MNRDKHMIYIMYARSMGIIIEGLRGKVDQPNIKCGGLAKHHKNAFKSEAYPIASKKHEIFDILNFPFVRNTL